MMEEKYYFNSMSKFLEKAKKLILDTDTINHELAHYRTAKKLGYKPQFSIIRSYYYKNQYRDLCSVIINENVNDKDSIQIALAPKKPDFTDIVIAEEAKRRLRRKRKVK